jgi:hypothetical protein
MVLRKFIEYVSEVPLWVICLFRTDVSVQKLLHGRVGLVESDRNGIISKQDIEPGQQKGEAVFRKGDEHGIVAKCKFFTVDPEKSVTLDDVMDPELSRLLDMRLLQIVEIAAAGELVTIFAVNYSHGNTVPPNMNIKDILAFPVQSTEISKICNN